MRYNIAPLYFLNKPILKLYNIMQFNRTKYCTFPTPRLKEHKNIIKLHFTSLSLSHRWLNLCMKSSKTIQSKLITDDKIKFSGIQRLGTDKQVWAEVVPMKTTNVSPWGLFFNTSLELSLARAWARWALKVLFPTPPFPDNTRILCLTVDNFSPISAIAVEEHGGSARSITEPWICTKKRFPQRVVALFAQELISISCVY